MLNAEFVGMMNAMKRIHFFRFVNAEEVFNIFIINASRAGLKPKNSDLLPKITLAYIGGSSSVTYASRHCLMFSRL